MSVSLLKMRETQARCMTLSIAETTKSMLVNRILL